MANGSVKLDDAIIKRVRAYLAKKYEGELYGKIGELVSKAVSEYLDKEKIWDCRKKIITNENKVFFKINSQGLDRIAIIKLFPWATTQCLSIPPTKWYGIKLILKGTDGNEVQDDAIIKIRKEDISKGTSEPIGEYEYRQLKRDEVTSPESQVTIKHREELVIYAEEKYAGKVYLENFRFIVDLCVKQQELPLKAIKDEAE